MSTRSRTRAIQIAAILAIVAVSAAVYANANGLGGGLSRGPDVTIINLSGIQNYTDNGSASACPAGYVGTCRGYSVGTDSCNIGTHPVDWCDSPDGQQGNCRQTTDEYHPIVATNSDHSVIAQNLYRLKDGRFEQIGMSYLKHGFTSLNSPDAACSWNNDGTPDSSCIQPPEGGNQLGLGCTDFYSSSLNGNRPLGRRSDVQASGGKHPTDPAGGQANDAYDQRIVVQESDLDPTQNAGALYWMEGHYVVRDDARAGNGLNNASYRAVNVGGMPDLDLSLTGSTIRETPAIFAWQVADPAVEIVQVDRRTSFTGEAADVPATGQTYPNFSVTERFHVARRISENAGVGFNFHYEYAIYNMNSDTSADGFEVQFAESASFGNVGFHSINHHSGEPYDTSDWQIDVDGPNGRIMWSAVDAGANTNALRWGTLYTFWFDSDVPPLAMTHSLDLFKIDEVLAAPPFTEPTEFIFFDGFESGNTSRWDSP